MENMIDEGFQVANIFQAAGFPHVGTFWPTFDPTCPDLFSNFTSFSKIGEITSYGQDAGQIQWAVIARSSFHSPGP